MSIVFDIETGPLPQDQLESLLPIFDPEEVKCGNLGSEKAKEKIEKARAEHREKFFSRAALSPETGCVLAIGRTRKVEIDDVEIKGEVGNEKDLLFEFWDFLDRAGKEPCIGHNILGFDLPFLVRRSWMLGLGVPCHVREGRYWAHRFIDTMEVWTFGVRGEFISLDRLALIFGTAHRKTGNGAKFAKLWETPETHVQAIAYLQNDVLMTAEVAERLGLI